VARNVCAFTFPKGSINKTSKLERAIKTLIIGFHKATFDRGSRPAR
jgi:hypothetical protein